MSCEVPLLTSDKETVKVDRKLIRHSILIEDMLQGVSEGGDATSMLKEAIPINVNAKTLEKVLEWCEHHKEETPVGVDEDPDNPFYVEKIPTWDEEYLKMDPEQLRDVIMACNYLNIRLLMEMACKTVADKMKGRTPEELRMMFNIENDLTEEDLKRIEEENSWCESW